MSASATKKNDYKTAKKGYCLALNLNLNLRLFVSMRERN